MPEAWISVDKVVAHLGVAKDSVHRWIQAKGLPTRKLGRRWKCKLSEVDALVRTGGVDGESSSEENRRCQISAY